MEKVKSFLPGDFEVQPATLAESPLYEALLDEEAWKSEEARVDTFVDELEELVKDWASAITYNRQYARQLGWGQYYDQINNLLLPIAGMQNVSLAEDAFAQAVSEWQRQHGFAEQDCDGIIGPVTWKAMQPMVSPATGHTQQQATSPISGFASTFEFNNSYARQILDAMNNGIIGEHFGCKGIIQKIANGEQVLNVNPQTKIIQILPVMHHIARQAVTDNYKEIIFGSFIRGADSDGSCTGHCAGTCIDINYSGGTFTSDGAVQMVLRILQYLTTLPDTFKKKLGFGLPLQGDFFGSKPLTKYRSTNPANLGNAQLQQLIQQLGIVFPDNDNHLHIQVSWLS